MSNASNYPEWSSLLHKLPIPALVYERATSKVLMLNGALINLLGYSQTAFSDMACFLSTTCPNDEQRRRLLSAWMEAVDESERSGMAVEPLEVVLLTRHRQECFVRLEMVQEPTFAVVFLTNMNAYNEMETELKRVSTTDYLTGLPNRKYFMDILVKQLDHSRRYREDLTLLMMNLDNFKAINEQYGWEAGDGVILKVTEIVLDCIRACDLLSRVDSDTYCVLLPATGDEGGKSLAERIRQTVGNLEIALDEGAVKVTVSIGLAHAYKGVVAPEQLLARSQKALADAKAMGKDCIASYQSQIIF